MPLYGSPGTPGGSQGQPGGGSYQAPSGGAFGGIGDIAPRAANIPPALASAAPDAAMALLSSRLFNSDLGIASTGIQQVLARLGMIPMQALARIGGKTPDGLPIIPPGLQPFAYWLVNASRQSWGGGFAAGTIPSMNKQLDKAYDPFGLSNLILRASPGHVVLRNSVQDMLAVGHGTPGRQDKLTILAGDLAPHLAAGYRVVSREGNKVTIVRDIAALAAQPTNPDFQRAQLLLATLQKVYPGLWSPDGTPTGIAFESGGTIGRLLHQQTQDLNIITAGPGFVQRETTHLIAQAAGYKGERFAAPTIADTVDRALHSASWEAGNDFARSVGMVPSDAAYAPVAGVASFVAGWYLDPMIVAGKVSAGFRLAKTLPVGDIAAETAAALKGKAWLTQKAYMLAAKSVPDLIASPGGASRVDQGWNIVNAAGDASKAAADLHSYWGKYVSVGGATHLAEATSKQDFAYRLAETFRPPGLDVAATYRNIDRMQTELNELDSALRLGQVSDVSVQRQLDLVAGIKTERAKLTTPQTTFMGDPTRLLPSTGVWKRVFTRMEHIASSADPEAGIVKRILNSNAGWLKDASLSPSSLLALPGTRFSAERWFGEISHRSVYGWHLGNNAEHTESSVRNYEAWLLDRGLTPTERRDLVAKMLATKDPQEWANVFFKDTPEAIANSKMPNWAKSDAQSYFQNLQSEEYSLFPANALLHGDDVLGSIETKVFKSTWWDEATNAPIPARPNEMADVFILPSHDSVLNATGFWRRRVLGGTGKAGKGARQASMRMHLFDGWAVWQRFLNSLTTGWRDAVLLSRPLSVMLRTQLEQQMRIPLGADLSLGMRVPAVFWNKLGRNSFQWSDKFLKGDLESLGLLGDDLYYSYRAPKALNLQHWNLQPMAGVGSPEFIGAWSRKHNEIIKELTDPLGQQLAAGAGVDDAVRWLTESPEGQAYHKVMSHQIARGPGGDAQLERYVRNRAATNADIIGGNEQVRRLIATGGERIYTSDAAVGLADVQRSFDEAAQMREDAVALTDRAEAARQVQAAKWMDSEAVREIMRYSREHPESSKGMARMDRLMRKAIANKDTAWIRENFPGWLETHGAIDVRTDKFVQWLQNRYEAPDGSFPYRGDPSIPDPSILPGLGAENAIGPGGPRIPDLGPGESWKSSPMVAGKPFDPWLDVQKQTGWGSRHLRNKLYRGLLSKPDAALSRVPLYRGLAERRLHELLSLGYDRSRAEEFASRWAKEQTANLLYDLGTRTSAQYFFRHLFPFMPAYEEIMKTWMWQLPMNRGGPLIGHAYIATRASQVMHGLKALGIDLNHPLAVPFLGPLLATAMGAGPDVRATFNPQSLNMVASGLGFLPGTGPALTIPVYWGGKQFKQFEPVAKYLQQNFDPALWPSQAAHLWFAAFGTPPPMDYLSQGAEDNYYAMAKDKAIRFAHVQLAEQGVKQPRPDQFKTDAAYKAAKDAYQKRLIDKATLDMRTWQLGIALWASFWPAPVTVTDAYAQDVTKFYDKVLAPLPEDSPLIGELFKGWLADHPYGDYYLTGTSDTKPGIPTTSNFDYKAWKQQFDDGTRTARSPEEFTAIAMGLVSRHFYQAKLQSELDKIGNAGDILTHWGQYQSAKLEYTAAWHRYMQTNPDFRAWWDKKYPQPTDTELLFTAFNSLHELQPYFTVGGIRRSDYKKTLFVISDSLSKAVNFKGGSYDQAKDVSWWFDNVFRPNSDRVEHFYNTIDKANLNSNVELREATYAKLRDFYDSQRPVTRNGITYPTIEQWSWGAKLPDEQGVQYAKWAMGKPEWLTAFQRQTVGYPDGPEATKLSDFISTRTAQYYQRLAVDPHAHGTGSEAWTEAQKVALQNSIRFEAHRLGGAAARLYSVIYHTDGSPLTPAERLDTIDHWAGDPTGQGLLDYAHAIITQLQRDDLSPTGNSAEAVDLKTMFFNIAKKAYDTNQTFRDNIDPLHKAQSPDWTDPKLPWNDLWAELFFGQFPFTLRTQTTQGSGVAPKGYRPGG